jgi:hypothetical protein
VLRAAFSAASGGAGGAGGRAGSSTPTPTARRQSRGHRRHRKRTSAAAAPITPSAGPSTGGFIQADPSTNSLIITAPEPLYRQVRSMIDQLDERRAQVYIESLIVEVTGDNAADFGFQWQGLIAQQQPDQRARRRHQLRRPRATCSPSRRRSSAAEPPPPPPEGTRHRQRRASAAGLIGEGLNIALLHNFYGTIGLARSRASCRARPTPTSPRRRTW